MLKDYPIGTKIRILPTANTTSLHVFYWPNDVGVVRDIDPNDGDLRVDFNNQGNPKVEPNGCWWLVPEYEGKTFEGIDFEVISDTTPLWGVRDPNPLECCIEQRGHCGCALGQCAKGLIY